MTTPQRVLVFTSPSCSWCRAVKDHLKKNHVTFREIDVSRDPSAARDLVRMTGQQGVPVVMIGSRPIVGFKREEIDRLLNIRRTSTDN
jgi:glutaredoxin 3